MQTGKAVASLYNLLFNYINTILTVVYGIVLVPLYLHYFDITTYGAWLASGSVIALMGIFDLGMNLVFAQRLAAAIGAKQWTEYAKEYTAGMFVSVIVVLLISMTSILLAPYIPSLVKARPADFSSISESFIIAGIAAAFSILYQNMAAALQALLESKILGWITTLSLIAGITVTVLCLFYGAGVLSIPLGLLARNFLTAVAIGIYTIRTWRKHALTYHRLEKQYVLGLLKMVAPVFASRTGTMLLKNNQLIIIASVLGPAASAIYSITSRAINTIAGFTMPIASSVFAGFSQLHGEKHVKKILDTTYMLLRLDTAIACIAVLGCVFLNRSFIHLWLDENKYGGDLLTVLIAVSFIVTVRTSALNMLLMAFGKMISTSLAELFTALVQFVIILVCIAHYGIIAVPAAEIISVLLLRFFALIRITKQYFAFSWKDAFALNLSGYELLVPLLAVAIFLQKIIPLLTVAMFVVYAMAWSVLVLLVLLAYKPYKRFIDDMKVYYANIRSR